MTVREVIAELQKCDPDALLAIPYWESNNKYSWKIVETVETDADDVLFYAAPAFGDAPVDANNDKAVTIW